MATSASPIYPDLDLTGSKDPLQGQRLELSVLCSGLKYTDPNKSSSRVLVRIKESGTQNWKEFGRTEVINGGNDPEFEKKFIVDYFFEESAEELRVSVYNAGWTTEESTEDFADKLEESCTKGKFILTRYSLVRRPTFRDFIEGGMELSFIVGIDFTESNGDPSLSQSLHVIDGTQPNQYELAIQAVGKVREHYDTDKKFPAFGFGARIPPFSKISHKFPINFNAEKPACKGVRGVLEAYKKCVRAVRLSGPTNFAPIIRFVAERASRITDASDYKILLIITDGVCCDKEATTEAIVQAARFPMSIIIVGVGNEKFDDMIQLDGDNVRLSFGSEEAERDIVQFVALREHISQDGVQIIGQKRMNAKLLEEIPDQIIQHMRKHNYEPNPPPPGYHSN